MAERPILFSGPLVQSLLAGRKTETRRLITKGTSRMLAETRAAWGELDWTTGAVNRLMSGHDEGVLVRGLDIMTQSVACRIHSGDTLWVRETHALVWGDADPCECPDKLGDSHCPIHDQIEFRADTQAAAPGGWDSMPKGERLMTWSPSIFMPKWASRIKLRVTEVGAERVQQITDDGAKAEGIVWRFSFVNPAASPTARGEFSKLWDAINGKREGASWDANPWVWVIKFEVMS